MRYYVKDDAGNLRECFNSIEKAKAEYLKHLYVTDSKTNCSLCVAGSVYDPLFCVAEEGVFTNCRISDLKNWHEWFDLDWIQHIDFWEA